MTDQRRHEAPAVGAMMVRMLRALVNRAAEGDCEALEQLALLEQLTPLASNLGLRLAHDQAGYSWGELAKHTAQTRQGVQQRASRATTVGIGHVLVPGHDKRACEPCGVRLVSV